MDKDTLALLTTEFKYCSYKVCGKPHWSGRGLFSRPEGGIGWSDPKRYCNVVCYAKDVVYEETGRICEVLF